MSTNEKIIFLTELNLYDAQVNRLIDKLGRSKSYSKKEQGLEMIIKDQQNDNEGLILLHNPFIPIQYFYFFSPEDTNDEIFSEKVKLWRHKVETERINIVNSNDRHGARILIYLDRRKLKAIYDFDICTITPIFSTLSEPESTVAELCYKGNIIKTDKNFLVDKELSDLLISLLTVFWRTNIANSSKDIIDAELRYQGRRDPDKSIKEISYSNIYNRTNDSYWKAHFGNEPTYKDIDRNKIDMDDPYFLIYRSFNVPKDTNKLLNKFLSLKVEQQRAFHRASDCYKMAINYITGNHYLSATYFAISIEALAKFEFKHNKLKRLKKSSDYYKEFFYKYIAKTDYLESLIGTIYKFRNDHVHEGYFPNKLWETTELTDSTLFAIESLVNYCLIRWILDQDEAIAGRLIE